MIITKDEYNHIAELQEAAKDIVNRVDIYRPFIEDPLEMYELVQEKLEDMVKCFATLRKVDDGLRKQNLR